MINDLLNKHDLFNKNIIVSEDSEMNIFLFDSENVVICERLSKAIKLLDKPFKKVIILK